MTQAHVHLFLNHVPILATLFGLVLLLLALLRGSEELRRVAFGVFVLSAAAAVPVYFTGEGAEHAIEHMAGVSEAVIHPHEEAGEVAIITAALLGLFSLGGLLVYRGRQVTPNWFTAAVLLACLGVSGVMVYTGFLGGQIRHTEIRSGQPVPPAGGERPGEHEGRGD